MATRQPPTHPSPRPEMVHIPAGPFLMGTSNQQVDWLVEQTDKARQWRDKGFFSREQPQHSVTLPGYFIGRYAVTVSQFRAFVEAEGYRQRRFWTDAGWQWRKAQARSEPSYWSDEMWASDDRLPVVGVSWHEAIAYCRWLSQASGVNYRLPTEAEWEKAARGADGQLYPWGDVFDARRCNVRASSVKRTTPVGRYSPGGDSPFGCADMVGNVSEWTMTKFKPYPYERNDGRDDAEGETERVTRGGSWHSPVLRARTTSRGMNHPFFADNDLGFRCAQNCG